MKKWMSAQMTCALLGIALMAAACGSDTTTTADTTTTTAPTTTTTVDVETEAGDHDHGDADGGDHDHVDADVIEASDPIPGVSIEVTPTDAGGVYDLVVSLSNFTVDEEAIDGDPVDNEGHMHLLVDGVKVERFTDLERTVELDPGMRMVEVELNANNHLPYAVDGVPIRAMAMVDVPGEPSEPEADIKIQVSYMNGEVTVSNERVEVPLGSVVAIDVLSDVNEEVHVHGYDIKTNSNAGSSVLLEFTARIPGRFEVEFEHSGALITELIVS